MALTPPRKVGKTAGYPSDTTVVLVAIFSAIRLISESGATGELKLPEDTAVTGAEHCHGAGVTVRVTFTTGMLFGLGVKAANAREQE
jgi:hypothetical protein